MLLLATILSFIIILLTLIVNRIMNTFLPFRFFVGFVSLLSVSTLFIIDKYYGI